MEDQHLRTDVPPRVYAFLKLNAPAIQQESELARYWIQRGIEAEIAERRRQTGENIDMNEELVKALETFAEHGEIESDIDESGG